MPKRIFFLHFDRLDSPLRLFHINNFFFHINCFPSAGNLEHFQPISTDSSDFGRGFYDYNRIMHYSNKAFSKCGKPIMVAKENPLKPSERSNTLNDKDVEKINRPYNCQGISISLISHPLN